MHDGNALSVNACCASLVACEKQKEQILAKAKLIHAHPQLFGFDSI